MKKRPLTADRILFLHFHNSSIINHHAHRTLVLPVFMIQDSKFVIQTALSSISRLRFLPCSMLPGGRKRKLSWYMPQA
jgi:hypothetical protein